MAVGRRYWQWVLLLLILVAAAALRLTAIDWDNYEHFHPDERFISWVATTIEVPEQWQTALDPHESTFNPFYWPPGAESKGIVVPQDEPRHFAYGHLPLYLGVVATRLVEGLAPLLADRLPPSWLLTRDILNQAGLVEFRHLTAVARALTALVDVGTVALVFFLGRRLFSPLVGLLAAAFLAVNVMHVQLAHFFAVDPYLTFFTVATVYALVVAVQRDTAHRSFPFILVSAALIGLAVGSKFSAVLLFLPLALALWFTTPGREELFFRRLLAAGLLAVLVFVLTNPFAVLDWSCTVVTPSQRIGPLTLPAINWGSCYLENIARQSAMVRGDTDFAFTRQYAGTLPYLYPVVMQLRWGMGLLLGLAAFAGFLFEGVALARRALATRSQSTAAGLEAVARSLPAGRLVVFAWTLPYFLFTGSFFVKFMRYMQPLTPFLMIYAAALLLALPWRRWRYALSALVLLATTLYALAFVSLYAQPHPWLSASRWIYQNLPPGALILSERWDDPLPASIKVDGIHRRTAEYNLLELDWLTDSDPEVALEEVRENAEWLARGNFLAIATNRNYGVVGRQPERFPLSARYYELLFSGELGYEPVYVTSRSPQLGPLSLWPDRFDRARLPRPSLLQEYLDRRPRLSPGYADESFTVYDQPLVIIFENRGHLSAEEIFQRITPPTSR